MRSNFDKLNFSSQQPNPNICVTGTDDFVVVDSVDAASADGSPASKKSADASLGRNSDGYTWSKRLVFRAKLTMHTAFERCVRTTYLKNKSVCKV